MALDWTEIKMKCLNWEKNNLSKQTLKKLISNTASGYGKSYFSSWWNKPVSGERKSGIPTAGTKENIKIIFVNHIYT